MDTPHPGGLRPPDPLHLGGCAPKVLHHGELRAPEHKSLKISQPRNHARTGTKAISR